MDQFDVLYSISDLHIGGEPPYQMFTQQAALGAFFRWIAARDPGRRVGLVLNGDIVDFLARPGDVDQHTYLLTQCDAVKVIEKIFDLNVAVWDGLETFLAASENHEIILASETTT